MQRRTLPVTVSAVAIAAITALSAVVAVPPAAVATPGLPPAVSYTVTAGSTGYNYVQADSPAGVYIDKDGTFYSQQSTALYWLSGARYWRFSTGTDLDSVKAAPINSSVNPANSQDRNDDTTYRCNHSPTGVDATAAAAKGYPHPNYCDLIGTWVDPDTGDWVGLVHNEFTGAPFNSDGMHYDSIDYAVSTDQGAVWTIVGHALTSPYSTARGDTAAFPNETYYFGDGDQRLFVDIASGYFYVYYSSMVINKTSGYIRHEHVARAPISGKMATGTWQKWYGGAWAEPGVGGKESNLVSVQSAADTGHTPIGEEYNPANPGKTAAQIANGTMPDESDLLYMSVTYDAYLGLYIAEAKPKDTTDQLKLPIPIYATDNLSTQKWFKIGDTGSVRYGSMWYHWFLDAKNKTGNSIVGKTFREYCDFHCPNDWAEWREYTVDSSAPAAVVDPTVSYQIASGSGRTLAQIAGSSNSTSLTGATRSALASWSFHPLGDGAYSIINESSGDALGVSDTVAARAWGTAPVVTPDNSAAAVGQQWFIVPVRTASNSVVSGAFRIVNRHSGLVLGMSGANPVETTPPRAWTDTSGTTIGGGRTAAEQTLSFSPVDIAFGKTATASNYESSYFTPDKAIDGSATYANGVSTYWGGSPTPQWWQVDLQGQYDVSQINLRNYSDGTRYYQYSILASIDGSTWSTIATKSDTAAATASGDVYNMKVKARYLRVETTKNSANHSAHIVNFAVSGTAITNLALRRPVTGVDEGAMHSAEKAVDGGAVESTGKPTYWATSPLPQPLVIDLQDAYAVGSITVANYSTGIRYYKYSVEGSVDKTTWFPVAEKTSNSIATWAGDTYAVSVVARYFRITVINNSVNDSGHISNVVIR